LPKNAQIFKAQIIQVATDSTTLCLFLKCLRQITNPSTAPRYARNVSVPALNKTLRCLWRA